MVVELGRPARLDAVVRRVVRSRRELVDADLSIGQQEELDAERTHSADCFHSAARNCRGMAGHILWQRCRGEHFAADVEGRILTGFDHGILGHLAIEAADDKRGQLTFELDQGFGEQGAPGPAQDRERGPGL